MLQIISFIIYIISLCLFCYSDYKNNVQDMVFYGVFSILLYLIQITNEIKEQIRHQKGY